MDDPCTRGWTKEASWRKMKKMRIFFPICMPGRAENEGWLHLKAVDQICSTGTAETSPLILLAVSRPVPAEIETPLRAPSTWAGHQWSQAGGKGGSSHCRNAQLLKKEECFHFEKCLTDQALQALLGQVLHRRDEKQQCCISTGRTQAQVNEPFSHHSFLPWEGAHFSGMLQSTSADSSETFLPSWKGCPHSHAQGPYINLLRHQKCKTACPSLLKWWHHGISSLWLKNTPMKNPLELTSR